MQIKTNTMLNGKKLQMKKSVATKREQHYIGSVKRRSIQYAAALGVHRGASSSVGLILFLGFDYFWKWYTEIAWKLWFLAPTGSWPSSCATDLYNFHILTLVSIAKTTWKDCILLQDISCLYSINFDAQPFYVKCTILCPLYARFQPIFFQMFSPL